MSGGGGGLFRGQGLLRAARVHQLVSGRAALGGAWDLASAQVVRGGHAVLRAARHCALPPHAPPRAAPPPCARSCQGGKNTHLYKLPNIDPNPPAATNIYRLRCERRCGGPVPPGASRGLWRRPARMYPAQQHTRSLRERTSVTPPLDPPLQNAVDGNTLMIAESVSDSAPHTQTYPNRHTQLKATQTSSTFQSTATR